MGGVAAVVGAVVGAYSAKKQHDAQKDAAKAQERSERLQQKIRDQQTLREKRKAIRASRLARATAVNNAASAGTFNTSSAVTGAGSIVTQGASNLSFLDTVQGLSTQASMFNIEAAKHQSDAATWGAIGGLGSTLFTASGGFDAIGEGYGKWTGGGNSPKGVSPSTPATVRVRPHS